MSQLFSENIFSSHSITNAFLKIYYRVTQMIAHLSPLIK